MTWLTARPIQQSFWSFRPPPAGLHYTSLVDSGQPKLSNPVRLFDFLAQLLHVPLFVSLEDDFLCFHVVEQLISLDCLTHWHDLVCHEAGDG
jgi:hypothetical protein